MIGKSSQIEINLIDGAAVVRFRRTECLLTSVLNQLEMG
jgi:hypothetical protein